MAGITRRGWCGVVVALGGLCLLGGCSTEITGPSVRSNMEPELETMAMTHEQRLNEQARSNNERNRGFNDDLDYILMIDRPTMLSKYPVP